MLVAEIVKVVRDFLKDPDGDMWQDSIIFFYLKQSLLDFAKKTYYFKKATILPIQKPIKRGIVPLPNDHLKTLEAWWGCDRLKIVTSSYFNNCVKCRDCTSNNPKYIISNLTGRKQLKLYPAPSEEQLTLDSDLNEFGVFVDFEDITTLDTECIGYESIEEVANNFGTEISIVDTNLFGVVEDVELVLSPLNIWYVYIPYINVDFTSDLDLQIDDLTIQALIYYTTGHLLRQDKDQVANNIALQQLKLYDAEVEVFKKLAKRYHSSTEFSAIKNNIFDEVKL